MIKVTNARFLQSCERFSQAPSILGAEIAILGRSNVGKSSLINALLNHKNLAKSSATPGKTRLINFFSAKWRVDCANLMKSQNLGENNPSLRADSQNLRGNPPYERFAESSVDSATPSPLSLDSFSQKGCTPLPAPPTRQKLPLFAFRGRASLSPLLAKNRRLHFCNLESDFLHHEAGEIKGASHGFIRDSSLRLRSTQNDNMGYFTESNEKIKLKKPFKSFCYFWLLPKVESPLPLNPNLPNSVDSAESQNLQNGLPRSHSLARNDENLDSSLRLRSTQNDKNSVRVAESSADSANLLAMTENNDFAESNVDSAIPKQDANSSIFDEKSGLRSHEREDRTNEFIDEASGKLPDLSQKDEEFEIRILDFPGFGYAKVSKAEKSSWDRHLSEFLHKRDSIKLYLHLIDARHQNLELDNEIFAFLNRFKRGDSAILQVFTKADKLGKNELSRLKKQHKFYHAINDKNSTEILRRAILKLLYNVDF